VPWLRPGWTGGAHPQAPEATHATIDQVASSYAARGGVEGRIHVARLINSLGARRPVFDALLDGAASIGSIDGGAEALDRLRRLEAALRNWPEAAAIVMLELENETVFVCASGDVPAFVVLADSAYRAATWALTVKLAEELDALELVGTPAPRRFSNPWGEPRSLGFPQACADWWPATA
jgi:hypothetical protein